MAVASTRTIQISFSGDVTANLIKSAIENPVSPGVITFMDLSSGPNTVIAPSIADVIPTALTIIPPSANTILVILKGVSGDTGIPLNLIDPTTIAIDESFVSLVLDAADDAGGFQLIWN